MEILDENRIPAILAVSNADGKSFLNARAVGHALKVQNQVGGSNKGSPTYMKDENRKVAFYAVSSADGVTPVAVYVDSTTNALLINSN